MGRVIIIITNYDNNIKTITKTKTKLRRFRCASMLYRENSEWEKKIKLSEACCSYSRPARSAWLTEASVALLRPHLCHSRSHNLAGWSTCFVCVKLLLYKHDKLNKPNIAVGYDMANLCRIIGITTTMPHRSTHRASEGSWLPIGFTCRCAGKIANAATYIHTYVCISIKCLCTSICSYIDMYAGM